VEDAGAVREDLGSDCGTLRANVDIALTLYRNGSWAA
jgi:hypothetical protein